MPDAPLRDPKPSTPFDDYWRIWTTPLANPYRALFGPSAAINDGPDFDAFEVDVARSETLDRLMHAWQARFTFSISPAAIALAFADWAVHLANAPGKQAGLVEKAVRKQLRFMLHAARSSGDRAADPMIKPLPQDRRFADDAWRQPPFSVIYQSFLLTQQWWHNATTGVSGVSKANEAVVAFMTRQILDVASPSNFLLTNPEALSRTWKEGGRNLARGAVHMLEDAERAFAGRKPIGADAHRVGRDVALTPGKVIFRNELIELIQYAPTTGKTRPEPILIVPAWIMKYYILDLSPHNSLVRHLVEAGFTVFMISWRNPGAEQRDLGMDDYLRLGVFAALETIGRVMPDARIHGCGYCLGGTLLSIAAAAMARDEDDRLASLTLFAAQTDFTEAGELMLFINDSQVAYLEDTMWEQGYLDTRQMAGAFQLLRSNDLIWSQMVEQYLMGDRKPLNDLMCWNADATRMPYRMHSEYLRRLFMSNDLAEGRFLVDGRPVALNDLRLPIFAVGTQWDHVAPWRSVYKISLLTEAEMDFVLTSGGHNAGIVSEPGRPGRRFQASRRRAGDRFVDPDSWVASTPMTEGSWWPHWVDWLSERSGQPVAPPSMGAPAKSRPPLIDAPGDYVLSR